MNKDPIKNNYEKIKQSLFPQIVLSEEKDEELFREHLVTKGVYLHKQVYDAILMYTGKKTITYSEVSNFIRYDKSIRDKLYKYLSAAHSF